MHLLDVCLIKLVSAVRFGLGFTHDVFNFCTSHGHASFMHTFFLFLFYFELMLCFLLFYSVLFSLSLSLSLSQIEPLYGTQTEKIHSGSEPSSWFQVILLWFSYSILYSASWWEGQDGLLWELPELRRSSKTPGHSVGFLRHYATRCHSNSGMGTSLWETCALSRRVYSGVLLQHTRHRYLCASVCFYISRYTYHGYSGYCIRCITCP